IGIARGDNVRDRDIGVAAEIDSFHAQNIVAAAPAAGNAGIMVEEVEQPFVVEGCARHADRGVHAQWQSAALRVFTVGADDCGGKPVTFVERGRSRRHIGLCAEPNALRPITVLEARRGAERGGSRNRVYSRTGTKFRSRNTPVGSPWVSFKISTLCGAGVSRVTPARLSASELATDGNGRRLHQPHTARM